MKSRLFAERERIKANIEKDAFLRKQLGAIKESMNDTGRITSLPYTLFKIFYESGSRREYEREYFKHRKLLNAYAISALVYDDSAEYLDLLQDAVWAVLDEFTWALPAHIPYCTPPEKCVTTIDLFAAETAFTLAEIVSLFKNHLDTFVRERIIAEVRRRVIEPYLSGRENAWDERENNWAAVCAGSVGATFLYLADDEEIMAVMPRIKNSLECYLKGFGEDGACVEGINYWIYGFGYYTYFAELLCQYTDGKDNLFENEKVRSIAGFSQKIRLSDNKTVSFSDCGGDFIHKSGLLHFLAKKYDGIIVPDDSAAIGCNDDACFRFAPLIRDFAWRDTTLNTSKDTQNGVSYFADAAWYIKITDNYDFAAKAGTNNESHNHNDIASFILNVSGKSIITDPGRGEYTADYFSDKRYTYFAPSALAHSVPVINGLFQKEGAEHFGVIVRAEENVLIIDFEKAYEDKSLIKAERKFIFRDNGFTMTDRLVFDRTPRSIKEHFVTEYKPVICDDGLLIDGVHMRCGAKEVECVISGQSFKDGKGRTKTVYTSDLVILNPKEEMEMEFDFIISGGKGCD